MIPPLLLQEIMAKRTSLLPQEITANRTTFPPQEITTRKIFLPQKDPASSPGLKSQPGTSRSPGSVMSTSAKHPLTSQRPQHPQPAGPAANHNSGRAHLQDHPESGCLYKLASSSIQQDSTTRSRRDNFSGSGLSSSVLQRSHRDSFSGSPPGQLYEKVPLTDPYREARIAGGPRPGPAQTRPRAALPDVHLEIDAALPEAAATSHAERPPVVLDIPELEQLEFARRSEPPRR